MAQPSWLQHDLEDYKVRMAEELKGVDIAAIAPGSAKFASICAVGDKVVLAPRNAPQLLVYDVATEEVRAEPEGL